MTLQLGLVAAVDLATSPTKSPLLAAASLPSLELSTLTGERKPKRFPIEA
jgi:hypothetical protein